LLAVTAVAIPLVWGVLSAGSKAASTEPSSAWDGGDNLRAWQVADALFSLDEQRLRLYLQKGWNPNWLLDSEGNTPLHTLMLVCERNPTHDQAGLVNVARFLVAAGTDPSIKNKWGDTPLIIAKAPKYCGPDHPVVAFLEGR
jgi:ankyrin repeat protein